MPEQERFERPAGPTRKVAIGLGALAAGVLHNRGVLDPFHLESAYVSFSPTGAGIVTVAIGAAGAGLEYVDRRLTRFMDERRQQGS